ncbi:hypothetical protein Tco_1334087 [Tanacetum coccineum]
MDDPNITMEEYLKLEEEKARKRGKVFNWETVKYGNIWYDEDIHDLRSVKTKFSAISFNNEVSSKTLSCEPTISSLNDEIDFRVLFDDSDDEDYMENDNEKVNLPSPKPTVSYLDDLDFFKYFVNEFPAIVYNDSQTSKSDLLTKPILNPQHINEFDLNDETSLSEYDEEEQNVLYFNDLFPFNIIPLDDLKSEKDNDNNDIDIIQSSKEAKDPEFSDPYAVLTKHLYGVLTILILIHHMAPLPPRDQRHLSLCYQVKGYTEDIVYDFEQRLKTIFGGICESRMEEIVWDPSTFGSGVYTRVLQHLQDQRRTRQRTSEASTSTAQQDQQQTDP